MTEKRRDDALGIATDAYVYGYPLVLMNVTQTVQTNAAEPTDAVAPVNQFCHHRKLPDPLDTSVVRLNLDTLYSMAWLDLTAEPMVLQVPDMGGRYWLMQISDAWSTTVADPNSVRDPVQNPAGRLHLRPDRPVLEGTASAGRDPPADADRHRVGDRPH